MRSIRRQLVLTLFAMLLATFAAAGFFSYFVTTREVRELFDAQLIESARVFKGVINQPLQDIDWARIRESLNEAVSEPVVGDGLLSEGHSYEKTVAIQVWSAAGELLLRSPSAPEFSLGPLRHGFYQRDSGDHRWYIYTSVIDANGLWLVVAERSDAREELTFDIAASLAVGSLVDLALALWLSRRTINRELQPLADLRDAITQRDPDHLDVIELRTPRSELAPIVQEINQLLDRVRTSIERERRFLADAAHELRTPLAVLKLQAENALHADSNAERRNHLERLLSGVDRSTRVVEQLLLLARLDAKAQPFQPRSVLLDEVARDVLAQLAPLAHARRQDLALDHAGSGITTSGEPTLLGALLRNLVENALRHSPEGSEVEVTLREDLGQPIIQVRDHGPGIDPAHLGEITGRFVRGHSQDTQGSGIGLAIAAHIAELHSAQLHLANVAGGGLLVTLTFPRH